MPLSKAAKQALKEDLVGRFQKANATVVTHYRGLTVAQLTELRNKLRENDAEYKVVKNRIAKVALKDAPGVEGISSDLEGPVGVVFMYGDAAQATKSLLEFGKDKVIKKSFKVINGMMDGEKVDSSVLAQIAALPSKDVLLAKIVGSLVSPHRGILGVLNGVPRQLVQVINAIKDTKSE